jgi:hypothetical protein
VLIDPSCYAGKSTDRVIPPPPLGRMGSIMITTNKSVKDWAEVMAGDEVMTTALLDRLLHHCHVFNIQGRTYRLRILERSLKH